MSDSETPSHNEVYFYEVLRHEVTSDDGRLAITGLQALLEAERAKNAHLSRELAGAEAMAATDKLTGIANRRSFDKDLPGWMAELQTQAGRRYDDEVMSREGIIILGDLDNFKMINDVLGYQIGDHALRHFSAILESSIRRTDKAYRLGGDEFAVLATVGEGRADITFQTIMQRLNERLEAFRAKLDKQKATDASGTSTLDAEALHVLDASFGYTKVDAGTPFGAIGGIIENTMWQAKEVKAARKRNVGSQSNSGGPATE